MINILLNAAGTRQDIVEPDAGSSPTDLPLSPAEQRLLDGIALLMPHYQVALSYLATRADRAA